MQEFRVRVADFSFGAVARHPSLRFELHGGLSKFLVPPGEGCDLLFDVDLQDEVAYAPRRVLFDDPVAYAVGVGDGGQYLIRGWIKPGPFCVAEVDAGFRKGNLHVPAARVSADVPFYPLEKIDVVIAVNRFASTGDLVVHGAGIADRGKGYLFVGPSGAGKSTMSEIWASVPGAVVLGEDHTVVVHRQGQFWVHGGPWHANPERCAPLGVRLSAIFVLDHGAENAATRCGGLEGVATVLTNCFIPAYHKAGMQAIVRTLDRLGQSLPIYRLAFRPDGEAVQYIRGLDLG